MAIAVMLATVAVPVVVTLANATVLVPAMVFGVEGPAPAVGRRVRRAIEWDFACIAFRYPRRGSGGNR